jgi:hypothetical protein
LSVEERLLRDAESFKAEVADFDEKAFLDRVFRTVGMTTSDEDPFPGDAPAAGPAGAARPARGANTTHRTNGCTATR